MTTETAIMVGAITAAFIGFALTLRWPNGRRAACIGISPPPAVPRLIDLPVESRPVASRRCDWPRWC
jgi:hypothetical protein